MTFKVPDHWVILSVDNSFKKLLSGFSGGYLYGDAWRVSSEIVNINEEKDFFIIETASKSQYKCYKDSQGLSIVTAGVLKNLQETWPNRIEPVAELD